VVAWWGERRLPAVYASTTPPHPTPPPAPLLQPIVAVQVNGDRLKLGSSNFWDWNPGKPINPRGPFEIGLAASTRQVLRLRIR